jgi:hypothetical protein
MSNPNHPAWRVVGLLVGAFFIWRSIVDNTGKLETFFVGASAILVRLFRWDQK